MTISEIGGSLAHKLLIASPKDDGDVFDRSVVYIYEHNPAIGAAGLIVNKPLIDISFDQMLKSLKMEKKTDVHLPILMGGPVDKFHGYGLHSSDYHNSETFDIGHGLSLSSNIEFLQDVVNNKGPEKKLLTLGCSVWDNGQVEAEIASGGWFVMDATSDLLFDIPFHNRWEKALSRLGIDDYLLLEQGQA